MKLSLTSLDYGLQNDNEYSGQNINNRIITFERTNFMISLHSDTDKDTGRIFR